MKMTYTKSQFDIPDGKYLAKFLGVSMREDKPGDKPRLGDDGKPLPPAMTWDFEIAEGPSAGKRSDKLTGRVPTPKSGCGKMLAAITDAVLRDGQEVDLDSFVGKFYRVTIEDNRVSDKSPPVLTGAPAKAANSANSAPPGDGPPPDEATAPDPAAKWDYHDGQKWVTGQTTAEVQQSIVINGLMAQALWVRPAGSKDAKKADDFGFTNATVETIPY
jgi:hypothetical protein